jgi:hypothetical protein
MLRQFESPICKFEWPSKQYRKAVYLSVIGKSGYDLILIDIVSLRPLRAGREIISRKGAKPAK